MIKNEKVMDRVIFGKKKIGYNTILFPLSSKAYSGVGSQLIVADVDVFHYDKEAYKKKIKETFIFRNIYSNN